MDAFAILDADGSGRIEFHEMVRRFRAPEVVAFVEASKNKTLRQLLREDERRLERCFRALDADGSGGIERSEWEAYVTAMARERVVALIVLNAWALFFSVLLAKGERADATPVEGALMSLVAITMPVLVLDSVLFYLRAPASASSGAAARGCFACCEWLATCLGHVLAAPLLLLAGVLLWLSCEALARGRHGDDDDNAIRSDPVVRSFVVGIWARRSRALAAALADEEAGLKEPTPVI
ncbi:hypothetical protein JL720_16610 [Aureococcus anophagefferens]|nr:hypothetical protein JL720_16610 [Aureococcus anophagefferens]